MYYMYPHMRETLNISEDKKTITVMAYATKIIKADMAILVFELVTRARDSYTAKDKNDTLVINFNQKLRNAGIRPDDIFYTSSALQPIYDSNNQLSTYQFTTLFKVINYNLGELGSFLSDLQSFDVDLKDTVFTVKDNRDLWDDTFEEAIGNAEKRASKAAKELGVELDPVPLSTVDLTKPKDIMEEMRDQAHPHVTRLVEGFITLFSIVQVEYAIKP